jgi:hypothetical protein
MLMELDIFSNSAGYISASRASVKTGYASDYIGQLCRLEKIPGKLIGRTWYVDLAALIEYKKLRAEAKRKDGKSSDVIKLMQHEARGVTPLTTLIKKTPFAYSADERSLFPKPSRRQTNITRTKIKKKHSLVIGATLAFSFALLISHSSFLITEPGQSSFDDRLVTALVLATDLTTESASIENFIQKSSFSDLVSAIKQKLKIEYTFCITGTCNMKEELQALLISSLNSNRKVFSPASSESIEVRE